MIDLWNNSRGPSWDGKYKGLSTLVVLDEVASYCKPWSIEEAQINQAYRLGRHKGIDIISINQRFVNMPPIIRSQTDIFSLFQITEIGDLKFLQKLVTPQVMNVIQRLGLFEYINISL